jgi:hypothetical protein
VPPASTTATAREQCPPNCANFGEHAEDELRRIYLLETV